MTRKLSEVTREKNRVRARESMRARRSADPKRQRLGAFYDQMVELYGERCAICGAGRSPQRRLCIDHDHETDEIRGLLCFRCNNVLGFGSDSVGFFLSCIAYVSRADYTSVSFAEVTDLTLPLPEIRSR